MSPTINEKAYELLRELITREEVVVSESDLPQGKVTLLDCGVNSKISENEVGSKVAEASMGGLGSVSIVEKKVKVEIPSQVALATLSCQLAGWSIKINGKNSLGSGPARILARKPKNIIDQVGYHEEAEKAALILETDNLPRKEVCEEILMATKAKELVIAVFKGTSQVGLINILARVVELGVFRLNHLGYDVRKINYAQGKVPLSKPGIFATNDALIYSSEILFKVEQWDEELTEKAVSSCCPSYGKSFQEIFQEAGEDFYKIPPEIFAPAKIIIADLEKGKEYKAGEVKYLLDLNSQL